MTLSFADIRSAAERIAPHVHRTPIMTSTSFNTAVNATIFFKCENFQKLGAFKARGATNAVFTLPDNVAVAGVATHSSGNHAAALARAARLRGVPAHVVMPTNAPAAKVASVERQGARIIRCEPTLAAREAAAADVVARTGAVLIPPYDDLRVMAGQGTAALEFIEEIPDLDLLLVPVGGGGLLGGSAMAAKTLKPDIRVIGVEPALADDAARSFRCGTIQPLAATTGETVADGLRVQVGVQTFAVIRELVDDIATVSDAAVIKAMRDIWEVMKIIVEPSAAVPFAAIGDPAFDVKGLRVGIILSGGNLDMDSLPWQR